jgi:hypothetical protein
LDASFGVQTRQKEIKIHRTCSSGGKIKLSVSCHKFYSTLKNVRNMKEIFAKQNLSFLSPVPPALLIDDSAGRIARLLWRTNKEYFPLDIIPAWFSMLIYHLGDEQ